MHAQGRTRERRGLEAFGYSLALEKSEAWMRFPLPAGGEGQGMPGSGLDVLAHERLHAPPRVARGLGELGLLAVSGTITRQLEIRYLSRRLG